MYSKNYRRGLNLQLLLSPKTLPFTPLILAFTSRNLDCLCIILLCTRSFHLSFLPGNWRPLFIFIQILFLFLPIAPPPPREVNCQLPYVKKGATKLTKTEVSLHSGNAHRPRVTCHAVRPALP
jgi:hypothetical protein